MNEYVMVPRVPTQAMIAAGEDSEGSAERLAVRVWSAMLAAAPTPSADEVDWEQALERATDRIVAAQQTPAEDDAKDAKRYRLLREEGRDLNELLHLVVGINPGGHGTHIRALRHTHYLDAAIDAIANERGGG